MISIRNLQKSFDSKEVLHEVSLDIEDGKIIGLLGKSGVGKSTLARILTGLESLDSGSITLDGEPLWDEKGHYERKKGLAIQMVFQEPFSSLDPSQRIENGIKELLRFHKIASKEEMPKLLKDFVETYELDEDTLKHLPHQISGGEAERIALGKCLYLKPRLLILDEATSMLDASTQANILALTKKRVVSLHGSILMISHDEALLDAYCDSIYELTPMGILERKIDHE